MAEVNGAHFDALVADLEQTVDSLATRLEQDPARWPRGRAGKWTAGQHTEHVVKALELMRDRFQDAARLEAEGRLPPVPGRGPLQSLFLAIVVRGGWMPRGGSAIPPTFPAAQPPREEILRRLRAAPRAFRALGAGRDAAARERLWIQNPFMMRWHYALPEAVRIQAVHVRHHAVQIDELAT